MYVCTHNKPDDLLACFVSFNVRMCPDRKIIGLFGKRSIQDAG